MLWLEPEEGLLRGACTSKYRQFRGGLAQHSMRGGAEAPWAFAVLCSRWLLAATRLGCAFVMFADISGRHSWRLGWIEVENTDCGMNLKASGHARKSCQLEPAPGHTYLGTFTRDAI